MTRLVAVITLLLRSLIMLLLRLLGLLDAPGSVSAVQDEDYEQAPDHAQGEPGDGTVVPVYFGQMPAKRRPTMLSMQSALCAH